MMMNVIFFIFLIFPGNRDGDIAWQSPLAARNKKYIKMSSDFYEQVKVNFKVPQD